MAADGRQPGEGPQNLATAVVEVSERASVLVREEIELAKAELSEKATSLIKGSVVGIAAGVFGVFGVLFLLTGIAWVFYDFVFDEISYGFFIVAGILFLLAALAALIAYRAVRAGTPPAPTMAIDEARQIRATVGGGDGRGGHAPAAGAGATTTAPGAPVAAVGQPPIAAAGGQPPLPPQPPAGSA